MSMVPAFRRPRTSVADTNDPRRYQHPLLNKETGVYSYDELIVLRKTKMPAVLCIVGPARSVADATNSISTAVLDALEGWASR